MATVKSAIKAAVLIGLETTEGTEPALGDMNPVQVLDGSAVSLEGSDVDITALSAYFSKNGVIPGEAYWQFTLNTAMRGSEIDGTLQLPELHPLLLISGLTHSAGSKVVLTGSTGTWQVGETVRVLANEIGELIHFTDDGAGGVTLYIKGSTSPIVATDTATGATSAASGTVDSVGERLVYWLNSDASLFKTASIRFYNDGLIMVGNACRATVEFDFSVNTFPKANFTVRGLFNTPADLALSDKVPNTLIPPRIVNMGMKVGDYAPMGVSAISINPGFDLQNIPDVNAAEGIAAFSLVDRQPTMSLDPLADTIANYDPYAKWKSGATSAISGVMGSVAGNRWEFIVPSAQYEKPGLSNSNKLLKYSQNVRPTGDKDNDFYLLLG